MSLRDRFESASRSAKPAAKSPSLLRPGAFTSLFDAVPASMRKLVQGESSVLGVFDSSATSSMLYVLEDVEDVCCGRIGTAGKLCIKPRGECDVLQHGRSKMEELQPGLYVKAGIESVFCTPCVPLNILSADDKVRLLKRSFASLDEAIDTVSSIMENHNSQGEGKDPSLPKKRKLTLTSQFEDYILSQESVNQDENSVINEQSISSEFIGQNLLWRETTKLVDAHSQDLNTLGDDLNEISAQMGIPPTAGPPTLWVGFMELKHEGEDLKRDLAQKANVNLESKYSLLETRLLTIDREVTLLQRNTISSFELVEASINSMVGKGIPFAPMRKDSSPMEVDTKSSASDPSIQEDALFLISERVDELARRQDVLSRTDQPTSQTIKIGAYCFDSIEDVSGWAKRFLPPSFPFGCFIDVYSFMMRVKSHKDLEDDKGLSKMEKRKNLKLTSDEAIVVNAFEHPLPRGFNAGSSSEIKDMHYWLPGLQKKDYWEDESRLKGLKVLILKNMEGIRRRMTSIIKHRLPNNEEAAGLCRELLADTLGFMTALCAYVSDTFDELTRVGFLKADAWELVSKLVHRMFAEDCYQKRGIISEMLDSSDHESLGSGLIWGTFATHQVLRDYQKHGISNHPSIASEYVRFLVNNCGAVKIAALDKRCLTLETSVKDLIKLTATLEKKVDSLSNKADDAKRKAEEALKLAKGAAKK